MIILFKDKVALVTGAASGLGLATVQAFAAAAQRTARSHKTLGIACDAPDDAQAEAMADQTVAAFGRLDAAYNNAGAQNEFADAADQTGEDFAPGTGINLRGVWSCLKSELRQMRKQGSGAIVNCSSIAGLPGGAGRGAYHAAKHGATGPTRIADAVLWLCSPSSLVVGQALAVDGGYTLH